MAGRTLATLMALAGVAYAQLSPGAAARQWWQAHARRILDEFVQLLSVPNAAQPPSDLRRNAELISTIFQRRGVKTQLLEVPGSAPAVFGTLETNGASQTIIFYAHYDGQAVDPSRWATGEPYRPTLMSAALEAGGKPIPLPRRGWPVDPEWRLYARSSSDDKAPIIALAAALDALRAAQVPLRSNVKFFFEGEEEAGSPHLGEILERFRDLLDGDVWIFCDGPVHQNRQQQIVFGARGVVGLELEVYGARHELHSGHYGNWAPNPAFQLARLLASMKDAEGHVLVKDFYEGVVPLGEAEKRAIAEAPNFDASLRRELWLAETEAAGRLDELINFPSLNIRGLAAGSVGPQARNVIPATAEASLDIRLVKGMDYRVTVDRVIEHIRSQGFHVTETEPDEDMRVSFPKVCRVTRETGYNAVRTPMDLEISQRVIRAVEQARGLVIKLPTFGGSLPLYVFDEILGAPAIVVPIANHDNNQHSHNENIRLQNLWDGIETMAALIAMD
jgi:acetylornithine deacetylase/succinyl-diaminopimelate desuccinylase-like protein